MGALQRRHHDVAASMDAFVRECHEMTGRRFLRAGAHGCPAHTSKAVNPAPSTPLYCISVTLMQVLNQPVFTLNIMFIVHSHPPAAADTVQLDSSEIQEIRDVAK